MENVQNGEMRVAWFPQVPCKPFYVPVKDVHEASKIMDTLGFYDLFQLENNIKPDYCNMGVLEIFEDGEWLSWQDDETGIDDVRDYLEYLKEQEGAA